ncbi:MAG TPA: SAM-dependent methyltransferase, partial [Xanthomonadales bacterium]|nr:SAM-dependent methyltransferase [Xanthomonadales bacterium]
MSFTERFADRAGDYVAGRPSYPAAALDALFDGLGDAGDVLAADLGAGTGISSRLLAERGAQVLAIEPNQA